MGQWAGVASRLQKASNTTHRASRPRAESQAGCASLSLAASSAHGAENTGDRLEATQLHKTHTHISKYT